MEGRMKRGIRTGGVERMTGVGVRGDVGSATREGVRRGKVEGERGRRRGTGKGSGRGRGTGAGTGERERETTRRENTFFERNYNAWRVLAGII